MKVRQDNEIVRRIEEEVSVEVAGQRDRGDQDGNAAVVVAYASVRNAEDQRLCGREGLLRCRAPV